MKKNNLLSKISLLVIGVIFLNSCTKDNDTPDCVVNAPATYSFEVDNSSTVAYSGQTQRLQMHNELHAALSNSGTTEAMLNGMYAHESGNADFSDALLNVSSKQLRSKTAGYQPAANQSHIHTQIEAWFNDYATNVAPAIANQTQAAPGVAGFVDNRELNAKGMEYDQIITKSLIGALCLDQVVNGYLSPAKIGDQVDNTTRDPNEDQNATAMEHHWDEGFGYIYGLDDNIDDATINNDIMLGKYLNKFEDWKVIVYDAFIMGRAAIVNNCSDERDRQAQIIKETLSMVCAQKAIDYLTSSADAVDQSADFFHGLSEGYGFILSLQFTVSSDGTPYFSHSEVNSMLSQLEDGNGFWDVTDTELNQMADDIIARTGLNQ